jgi:hypothetical protein
MVEEAKASLDDLRHIAWARYFEHTECLHYLREKGCPEPTDEQYAALFRCAELALKQQQNRE